MKIMKVFLLGLLLFVVGCGGSSTKSDTLTEQEKSDLLVLREEEKLAYDVYITLYDMHSLEIFYNIAQSELQHTNAVLNLINKYGLSDPVGNKGVGEFENAHLQSLHDSLVNQGSSSLQNALRVGATVEDLDIYDIQVMKSHTTKSDLLAVYNNLQDGSRNHLRSFVRLLETYGGSYTPQYISQEEYDSIINN
jgi:hypothetical protein